MNKIFLLIFSFISLQSYANDSILLPDSAVLNLGNDTSICEGASITLSVDSGYNKYLWSTGDTTRSITVSDSGFYYVHVFNDSLQLVIADTIKIRFHRSIDARFTINVLETRFKFSFMPYQVHSPGISYYWEFGCGHTSFQYNAIHDYDTIESGMLKVKLTITDVVSACVDSSHIYLLVPVSGIDSRNFNVNNINVIPNPFQSNSIIKFELFKNVQMVSLDICDIMGRKIKNILNNENIAGGIHELPLSLENLNGMFIVKLNVDGIVSTYKIFNAN